MREFISPWGKYLKDFYEYKKLCGYKYEKSESVLFLFDRYYAGLNITELKFTRDIDIDNKTIYELKPMNSKGVRDGIRQLRKYNKALGGGYHMRLELY